MRKSRSRKFLELAQVSIATGVVDQHLSQTNDCALWKKDKSRTNSNTCK